MFLAMEMEGLRCQAAVRHLAWREILAKVWLVEGSELLDNRTVYRGGYVYPCEYVIVHQYRPFSLDTHSKKFRQLIALKL